jgi:hypothetical protein
LWALIQRLRRSRRRRPTHNEYIVILRLGHYATVVQKKIKIIIPQCITKVCIEDGCLGLVCRAHACKRKKHKTNDVNHASYRSMFAK